MYLISKMYKELNNITNEQLIKIAEFYKLENVVMNFRIMNDYYLAIDIGASCKNYFRLFIR